MFRLSVVVVSEGLIGKIVDLDEMFSCDNFVLEVLALKEEIVLKAKDEEDIIFYDFSLEY